MLTPEGDKPPMLGMGRAFYVNAGQVLRVSQPGERGNICDVMFINRGELVLDTSMEDIEERYIQLTAVGEAAVKAQGIPHLGSQSILGGKSLIYEGVDRETLSALGELGTPSIADLFVAKVKGARQ